MSKKMKVKGVLYSCARHIKDICGLWLLCLAVIIPPCEYAKRRPAPQDIVCQRMYGCIIILGLLLLAANVISMFIGARRAKTLRYTLMHNGMNILFYLGAIIFVKIPGLRCPEHFMIHGEGVVSTGLATSSCYKYSSMAFPFGVFMIGVYAACSIIAVIMEKRKKGKAEASA